jgi:hypothetical protein
VLGLAELWVGERRTVTGAVLLEARLQHVLAPTRLGPGAGLWHQIPVGQEKLRVHRRFLKDIQTADSEAAAA